VSYAPATIESSKCSPVSHKVSIVSVKHEHDHEPRTRFFIFRLSDPSHIAKMPEILSWGVTVGRANRTTSTCFGQVTNNGSSPVHDHGSFFALSFDYSFLP
jgi:hypothetical protein